MVWKPHRRKKEEDKKPRVYKAAPVPASKTTPTAPSSPVSNDDILSRIRTALNVPETEEIAPCVVETMTKVLNGDYFNKQKHLREGDDDPLWKMMLENVMTRSPFGPPPNIRPYLYDPERRFQYIEAMIDKARFETCMTQICQGVQCVYRNDKIAPPRISVVPFIMRDDGKLAIATHVMDATRQDSMMVSFWMLHEYKRLSVTAQLTPNPDHAIGRRLSESDWAKVVGIEESVHTVQARDPNFYRNKLAWIDKTGMPTSPNEPIEVAARPVIRKWASELGIALGPDVSPANPVKSR